MNGIRSHKLSCRRLVSLLVWSFISTFCYIDDVRSLNNSWVGDFVDRIYRTELEIKDTTHTDRFASYLDLHLEIGRKGKLLLPAKGYVTLTSKCSSVWWTRVSIDKLHSYGDQMGSSSYRLARLFLWNGHSCRTFSRETTKASQVHYVYVSAYTLYPFTTYYQADYDDLIYQVEPDI